MKSRPDFSLILACFNEGDVFVESVARIVEVLQASALKYEIIFVDDGSSDQTPTLIKHACQTYTGCRALFHRVNKGRGKTVSDGIMTAAGVVVGYIDIDCEVGPVYIPKMVSLILKKKADITIGKRIYRTNPGSLLREVLSRGYQWLSHVAIGTGRLDTETGYKFFLKSKIVPILKKTEHSGWFWDTEIMVRARRAGLHIVEVPVLFIRRFDKHSSVHIVRDSVDYLVNLWRFRRKLMKPINQ